MSLARQISSSLRLGLPLLAATLLLAGSDDWNQLKELGPGELRVQQRTGATLTGTLDRVTEDAVILTQKSGQTAVQRLEIVRVDWRPAEKSKLAPELSRRRRDYSIPKDRLDLRPNQDWIGNLKIDPKTGYRTIYQVSRQP